MSIPLALLRGRRVRGDEMFALSKKEYFV